MSLFTTDNPKEMLDAILKVHGIDYIKDYVKATNKSKRKASPRVNTFQDVYDDMIWLMDNNNGQGFSYTRAVTAIAEKRNISESVVKTHYGKGKKQANKIAEQQANSLANQLAKRFDINEMPF